ncbi:hypothetical protein PINS_up013178 [Pythium insidiosum]|nr:hypothetical protein PINS_up013178 [Pythium insidiosum]
MEKLQEAVDLASKDFPVKYAHFVAQTSSMLADVDMAQRPKLSILKKRVAVKQSLQQLSLIPVDQARSALEVTFERQKQIGNLHREWFIEVAEKLALPDSGIFTCTNRVDQTFHLNATASTDLGPGHLTYFHGAGRFVGRALVDGGVLPFHLSLPLLKMLVGTPLVLDDLQFFDPELYQSLMQVLETKNVQSLGLDFTVDVVANNGQMSVVDLIPNGRNITVTDENKELFVERKFKYTVVESVSSELAAFLRGVHEVAPVELLMLFDYEELDYLLCGNGEVDVDDWEKNTRISLTMEDAPRVVKWFWEIVREMDDEHRRRLLHFSTGCSRVPLVGFKGLTSSDGRLCPFTLKGIPYPTDKYMRSHACFNMIELPIFPDRESAERTIYATLDRDLYGVMIK